MAGLFYFISVRRRADRTHHRAIRFSWPLPFLDSAAGSVVAGVTWRLMQVDRKSAIKQRLQ